MERCMENQKAQAIRLLNSTGMVQSPSLDINELNGGGYRDLLYNASILVNETLVRCNKTKFLTVRTFTFRMVARHCLEAFAVRYMSSSLCVFSS